MKIRENGKWKWIFFLYALIIVRLIVVKYSYAGLRGIMGGWRLQSVKDGLESANFTLFKTIRMYIRYYNRLNSFENLFGNILIFIPYGILYPIAFPGRRGLIAFLPSLLCFVTGIELFQLLTSLGKFDVDDILLNCFGAVIGIIFSIAVQKIKWYDVHKR